MANMERPEGVVINLMRGWPNSTLLPKTLLREAAERVLSDEANATYSMSYGPDLGHQKLRDQLGIWLTTFYKPPVAVATDRIAVTGGASQSLACLLQVFTDPLYTRNIWMVAPTYFLAFRVFDDAGFHSRTRAVPEDEEGIDTEILRDRLRKESSCGAEDDVLKPKRPWGKFYRHVIYAVPTFSNPSARTMTLRRREELVRIAREFDALIITDDVYDFLQWPVDAKASSESCDHAVMPRVVDVDRTLDGGADRAGSDGFGNVASNGSFSKLCGPGLRTGWVEGTAKLAYGASQAGSTRSGGAPSHLVAAFLAEMLESGAVQHHIREVLCPSFASRYYKMMSAIHKHLMPLGVQTTQADREVFGGYFVWLSLPPPLKGAQVAQRAKDDQNLIVAQGELFEIPDGAGNAPCLRNIRLCLAWEEEDRIIEGIERLSRVIHTLAEQDHNKFGTVKCPSPKPRVEDKSEYW